MNTKQTKAQRLASLIGYCVPSDSVSGEAAALLLKQEELLKQAKDAMDRLKERDNWRPFVTEDDGDDWVPAEHQALEALTAIVNHLEAK